MNAQGFSIGDRVRLRPDSVGREQIIERGLWMGGIGTVEGFVEGFIDDLVRVQWSDVDTRKLYLYPSHYLEHIPDEEEEIS